MIPTPPSLRLGSAEAPFLARVERGQHDGNLHRDDGARIQRRTPTARPLMPGGLLASVTAQEAADLLTFLSSLR